MGTGYACPVCEVPQRDAEHLANHLAFTAMLRHEEHEEWLEEYVPGWGDLGPSELGERVATFADETEYEEVFEDTVDGADRGRGDLTGRGHQHDHGRERRRGGSPSSGRGPGQSASAGAAAETEAVLREARELTRQLLEENESPETGADRDEDSETGTDRDDSGADRTSADPAENDAPAESDDEKR